MSQFGNFPGNADGEAIGPDGAHVLLVQQPGPWDEAKEPDETLRRVNSCVKALRESSYAKRRVTIGWHTSPPAALVKALERLRSGTMKETPPIDIRWPGDSRDADG
jgi:hypothetical protein